MFTFPVSHYRLYRQFGRPASDVATGSWTSTGANFWDEINEVTANDSDLVTSDDNTVGDTLEVGLQTTLRDPHISTDHIVRYRYRKSAAAGHSIDIRIRLLQGVTEIGSWTHVGISETFTDAAQTLTAAEADSITDYTDLRLEFQRNGDNGGPPPDRRSAEISWAELQIG